MNLSHNFPTNEMLIADVNSSQRIEDISVHQGALLRPTTFNLHNLRPTSSL